MLLQRILKQIGQERQNAEEAIEIVKQILLSGGIGENSQHMKRKDVSELLDISMDTLRNWEMNGLLTVKRKDNGYRVYTNEDIHRLKIIRSLRCGSCNSYPKIPIQIFVIRLTRQSKQMILSLSVTD